MQTVQEQLTGPGMSHTTPVGALEFTPAVKSDAGKITAVKSDHLIEDKQYCCPSQQMPMKSDADGGVPVQDH